MVTLMDILMDHMTPQCQQHFKCDSSMHLVERDYSVITKSACQNRCDIEERNQIVICIYVFKVTTKPKCEM